MKPVDESDWRVFRALVPKVRERYLAARNAAIAQLLTAPQQTETARFWTALEEMEKHAQVLRLCLDGHTRSKMRLFLIAMVRHGMVTAEDLGQFSAELQSELSPALAGLTDPPKD